MRPNTTRWPQFVFAPDNVVTMDEAPRGLRRVVDANQSLRLRATRCTARPKCGSGSMPAAEVPRSLVESAIDRDEDEREVPAVEVRLDESNEKSRDREPLEAWQQR